MRIRKATIRDLKEIAKLFYEYGQYEHDLDKDVKLESLKEIIENEKMHFSFGCRYFIIEDKDKVLGCLNINIDKRGKDKVGVLHTLIVTKEARGKGCGNALVKYVLDYFKKKGCRRVKTFVHLKNKKAKDFWTKKGFNLDLGYSGSLKLK